MFHYMHQWNIFVLKNKVKNMNVYYHLPGLFEFYEFYKKFLPLFKNKTEYFYDWCKIGSIYGSPSDCIWSGGRISYTDCDPKKVFALMKEHNISSRLTFSNSLIEEKHLSDVKCNELCRLLNLDTNNGIIIHSDILMKYLKSKYPNLYFVSSTTKELTDFNDFKKEVENPGFTYVVPDFRLNKQLEKLNSLSELYKPKVEFLCNECCWYGCKDRKECYKSVSKQNLGIDCMDHVCKAPFSKEGYRFSRVMENPAFISLEDILNIYVPMGYSNFKIEGRDLGSALLLEFILYYMVKPKYQIHVREEMYLDAMLDLF